MSGVSFYSPIPFDQLGLGRTDPTGYLVADPTPEHTLWQAFVEADKKQLDMVSSMSN